MKGTSVTSKTLNTTARLGALLAIATLALSGCAAGTDPAASSAPAATKAGDVVTIEDAWVKAADDGMSAAFGVLHNSGDEDVTVVSAETTASTSLQLHETVENESGQMVMREKEGGFTVPADGDLTLEPGGNHIMLMELTAPIEAGDEVTFTLTFSDDSTYEFTAPAKDYTGADETYEGDEMDMGDDSSMDMGDDSQGDGSN